MLCDAAQGMGWCDGNAKGVDDGYRRYFDTSMQLWLELRRVVNRIWLMKVRTHEWQER